MLNAVVTGTSRGIGREIALELEAKGFNVIKPTRSELDLLDDASINGFLHSVKDQINVLVNCAGINTPSLIKDLTDENIENTIKVNAIAPMKLIRGLAGKMAKNAKIVNVSSIWAHTAKPGRAAYSASKAALEAFTKVAAVEFAHDGILINSVAPGFADTDLTRQNNSDSEISDITKQIPIGRLAGTAEIAGLVSYLCTGNTYITGQTITIDGGYSCL